MIITIHYFARIRELTGKGEESLNVPEGTSGSELVTMLKSRNTAMDDLIDSCRIAINMEFIDENHELHDGDEVAIIPPVSGG